MSCSRPKVVRKYRPVFVAPVTVEQPACVHAAQRLLRCADASIELGESLLLRSDQAERLSEFQRWHVSEPALCLTDARSIVCPVLDEYAQPRRTAKGQTITGRVILEVASRRAARCSRGGSACIQWCFVVWDERGRLAHLSTHRTRKVALALFHRPGEYLALSHNGNLVERPAASAIAGKGAYHA